MSSNVCRNLACKILIAQSTIQLDNDGFLQFLKHELFLVKQISDEIIKFHLMHISQVCQLLKEPTDILKRSWVQLKQKGNFQILQTLEHQLLHANKEEVGNDSY